MNGSLKLFHLDILRLNTKYGEDRFSYILRDITYEENYGQHVKAVALISKILKENTEAEAFVAASDKTVVLRLVNGHMTKTPMPVSVADLLIENKVPSYLQTYIIENIEYAFDGKVCSEIHKTQDTLYCINVTPVTSHGKVENIVVVLEKRHEAKNAKEYAELKEASEKFKKEIRRYQYKNEALLEQIERLRISLDVQKSFFVRYNTHGEIKHINKTFGEFLGARPQEVVEGLKQPEIFQEDLIHFQSAMREIRVFPFRPVKVDYRIVVNDKVFFTSWAISPFTDSHGNVVEYIASGMDMTKQMQHQQRIQLSEERFRLISKATNEAIWDWNILTNNSWWNEAMHSFFGFPNNTKANINLMLKAIYPADRLIVREAISEALSEKKTHWSCEFRINKKGKFRYFYNRTYLYYNADNMPERMLGSIMDITEKKLSILKYSQLNEKFEMAVKAGKTGIWQYHIEDDRFVFDKNLVALYQESTEENGVSNQGMYLLSAEKPPENVEAGYHTDLFDSENVTFDLASQIGKKGYNIFKKALLNYIEEADFEKPFEFIQKRKSKGLSIIWVLSRARVVNNTEGSVLLVGTDTDITEQKEAEEQMRMAKLQTDESMRTQEKFFSLMSHEIRSPLSGIIGMNDLLLSQSPRSDQEEFLSAIKFSADNLLVLINDLLDFSKIRAGKLEFEENEFDLQLLLKNTYLNYKTLTKDKNIAFELQKEDILPKFIIGDLTKLSQILNNLLSNAIKFTSIGSVKLIVSILAETEENISLIFKVKDTGIGIPQNKQKKIFEPFTQASKDTSRKYGGTGLGLVIVKNLVELQGGLLDLESQVGKGTTFTVKIDYKKEQNRRANEIGASFNKDLSHIRDFAGLNVLYVDDVHTNRLIMKGFASRWGIELETASDGFEGLHKVQEGKYELILMDLQMPGIDGYETTRRIRDFNDSYYKQVPIIALTADVSANVIGEVKAAGLTDCLSKPVNLDKLYELFKKHKISPKSPKKAFVPKHLSGDSQNPIAQEYDKIHINFQQTDMLFGLEPEGYFEFLEKSIKELKGNHKSLSHALMTNDNNLFRQVHHKMNSLLRLLELSEFNLYLTELKQEIKEIPENALPMVLGKLDIYFSGVLAEFKEKQSTIKIKIK